MLGRQLNDPDHTESEIPRIEGLGLLDISTTFYPEKITTQVEAKVVGEGRLLDGAQGCRITGYEIHMGRTELADGTKPVFRVNRSSGREISTPDGAVSQDGLVFGTYIHGIFDEDEFRRCLINNLRRGKGLEPLSFDGSITALEQRNRDFDKLAAVVRGSLDIDRIYQLIGLPDQVK